MLQNLSSAAVVIGALRVKIYKDLLIFCTKVTQYLTYNGFQSNECIFKHNCFVFLTLKAPIMTAADDNFCDIFLNFRKKIRHDISASR